MRHKLLVLTVKKIYSRCTFTEVIAKLKLGYQPDDRPPKFSKCDSCYSMQTAIGLRYVITVAACTVVVAEISRLTCVCVWLSLLPGIDEDDIH